MVNHIGCARCRFVRPDLKASEYTKKQCGKCELRENCEICRGCSLRDECPARKSSKHKQSCERRLETTCSQQKLLWTALECGNPDSEYYRALVNITKSGARLSWITWSGCLFGEKRCGQ